MLNMIWPLTTATLLLGAITPFSRGEVFTSMANIDMLLQMGEDVSRIIDNYVEEDERRLEQLKKLSAEYKSHKVQVHGQESTDSVIVNPVESFAIVKQLADNWRYVEQLMKTNSAEKLIQNFTHHTHNSVVRPPSEEDVIGMAVGLMRIQDVYKLDTHDMAEGKIRGVLDGRKLTAYDCLEIARVAYNKQDFYHTLLWATEAWDRVQKEDEPTIDEATVLEYIAFAMFKQGNIEWAIHYTTLIKQVDPNHPRASGNLKYYQDLLDPEGKPRKIDPKKLPPPTNRRPDDLSIPERDVYEGLCRSEYPIPDKDRAKLYCYYKRNRPYLKLAPIKVEVMHWKPKIVYFRGVISDEEIAVIKQLASPLLKRATVHNADTGQLETASYRISKSAWLKDTEHEVVKRISDRIDMMTDLTMETAELLQIANYGIGGHYDPHFDMSTRGESDPYEEGTGNRIATVLFYISQPEAGGGTVFTSHKITVEPSKLLKIPTMALSHIIIFITLMDWWCVMRSSAEVFTAMADVENLIHTEDNVVDVIEQYIESDLRRLQRLKSLAQEYRESKEKALKEGADRLYNPVNAFLFIKKLTEEWNDVELLMKSDHADIYLQNITAMRDSSLAKFPTEEDLTGAAEALLRLQDVYKLDTHELSSGRIKGAKQGLELDANGCFELGRVAYNQKDYYHVILWMQEALNRVEHENPPSVDQAEILEYLAYGMYQQGNVKRALQLTKRLQRIKPDHPRAEGNVKWYLDLLAKEGVSRVTDHDLPPIVNARPNDQALPERKDFEALCRGEYLLTEKQRSRLYCYYKRDTPFLNLAPIKVEVMHWKPKIVIFRQVISANEIAVLKTLAYPRLSRATVQNSETGELETAKYRISKRCRTLRRATVHNKETGQLEHASYRISKSAWLKEHEHPVVDRIVKRIHDMTNLNMETAEDLQIANYGLGGHYDPHFDHARIANYGIGGHYEPHFDMSTRDEVDPYEHGHGNRIATTLFYKEEVNAFKSLNTGNRIATVLFYISQPEAGGATVFITHKLAIFPVEGDAAFWFNLKPNGEGDMSTRHAACPVLAGVKWVANKWIHERGQEFYRPCGLREDDYE
ncbi:tetratricopeptide repeat protein [Trichinella nativa]|uniref:procollagen-proline 4-dioxygenase n=1 Tax=Trichinella nativa TaxID=6335 RepID=A0A1Y3ECV8_9BILA|nr:tetratricopeptide repeat protein [Trichinella nativa]